MSLDSVVESKKVLPSKYNEHDPLIFFAENKKCMADYLENKIEENRGIKWALTIKVKFTKPRDDGGENTSSPYFNSDVFASTTPNVEEQLSDALCQLEDRINCFERDGSGWVLDRIMKLEIKIGVYDPISGSSYFKLPEKLIEKKAVLNIKNNDNCCFKYSILAHLFPVTRTNNPDRVSQYKQHESSLDWSNIKFPTPLSDVPKFEKKNEISVNVFGYEDDIVFPLHITSFRYEKHVNLLLLSNGEKRHFCLIRNMSRLLGDRTKHNGETFFCNYCLHGFTKQKLLDSHIPYCSIKAPQRVSLPTEEEKWLKFENYAKGLKVPFVIYADFECFP